MSYFMVDVETDGPIPGDYSMIALGAVVVRLGLKDTFLGHLAPISDRYQQEALKVSNTTREQTLSYPSAKQTMTEFSSWIKKVNAGKPMFISDNNGFDAMFVSWYFHHFLGENPFGHSSTNLGSLYKGQVQDCFKNFKHLRKTKHTHNPVDDAMGNAEALLAMARTGLRINLE